MTDNQQNTTAVEEIKSTPVLNIDEEADKDVAKRAGGFDKKNSRGGSGGGDRRDGGRGRGGKRGRDSGQGEDGIDQKVVEVARVTRVVAGGKRMRFRACVVVGDKKGKVGMAVAKGADVSAAVNKAVTRATKDMIDVPIYKNSIPHHIYTKLGAAKIMMKPATLGTGIKAGGAMRIVLELAGVQNVIGKILGTNNKINNVKATILALSQLKKRTK